MSQELNDRLRSNDPDLFRLDITGKLLNDFTEWRQEDFFHAVYYNKVVKTVHLSGAGLRLSDEMMDYGMEAIGHLQELEELFVFRGDCDNLTEERLASTLSLAQKVKVLMIWGFGTLGGHPALAGAMRHHPTLQRITVTLPCNLKYASMDVYCMGMAEMKALECLSIRCQNGKQREPIISPEAITILFSSTAIESLYLENCGLIDDHVDAICEELKGNNKKLDLLDLKMNSFSDDAMYSFALVLPVNQTLSSLDLSGVHISPGGGQALAKAMTQNVGLHNLELEGVEERYRDEFDIPEGHSKETWMQALEFQLRLNRAGRGGSMQNRKKFVDALVLVADNVGLIYYFLRGHPRHCDRTLSMTPQGDGNDNDEDDQNLIDKKMDRYKPSEQGMTMEEWRTKAPQVILLD